MRRQSDINTYQGVGDQLTWYEYLSEMRKPTELIWILFRVAVANWEKNNIGFCDPYFPVIVSMGNLKANRILGHMHNVYPSLAKLRPTSTFIIFWDIFMF